MTERELRAVAEAINSKTPEFDEWTCRTHKDMAQAAISASDSKYVKGLVEALKDARNALQFVAHFDSEVAHDDTDETVTEIAIKSIDIVLQNLPEDLR